ncbi:MULTISPECIES: DsbE family thiol:disulfide interchange protein [Methylomonas]|uniref:Thiol:disulfide interchange protein n=2 Tax=Methylomonas TaxID=416 RepID=A0A140E6G8_9GAMM|nr:MULTISPECIES: DsbE family thiol:disulfide interchange protein [Methylomonas]AMK78992.1 thiol:disulfide interchange protein [Methylomonas denitrificans]OAH99153.1 thiol:disulfide interchange protein [Methylomonas methanica]TCV77483.1 cytochrome c biogenesis protein CcmG/thiol:disulfide interchange protein DsbE [Methylomonas methanica]
MKYLLPLLLFIALSVFLAIGLKLNPREIPSPLIDKPAPAFNLPVLATPEQRLSQADFKGKVWLLNVWASWCVSCREEHPLLIELAKQNKVLLVGLNYKDEAQAANAWLGKHGNPYNVSVMDADGRVGIDYGVYGVPETFVIDKRGVVRYKHTGPVQPGELENIFLPLIEKLEAESA